MNESYKELLTECVGKKLEVMKEISDYAPEKFVLRNLLGFLTRARSNEVIMAKLKMMIVNGNLDRSSKLSKAEINIAKDCLDVLFAERKNDTINKE